MCTAFHFLIVRYKESIFFSRRKRGANTSILTNGNPLTEMPDPSPPHLHHTQNSYEEDDSGSLCCKSGIPLSEEEKKEGEAISRAHMEQLNSLWSVPLCNPCTSLGTAMFVLSVWGMLVMGIKPWTSAGAVYASNHCAIFCPKLF